MNQKMVSERISKPRERTPIIEVPNAEVEVPVSRLELKEMVACPHLDFRGVYCQVDQRTLFLIGMVKSYHMKQMAQELARSIDGIDQIVNQLNVNYNTASLSNR